MIGMSHIVNEVKQGMCLDAKQYCDQSLLQYEAFIGEDSVANSGLSCLKHALSMVKILKFLEADDNAINACLVYSLVEYGGLTLDCFDQVDATVLKLVKGVQTMSAINQIFNVSGDLNRISVTDSMRRMMLSMVHDGRTVLIKIVEQVLILLHSKNMKKDYQIKIAKETMSIYAPLANRLGLSSLKWQLEDLAFRIQEPEIYKSLSVGINVNRKYREELVSYMVDEIKKIMHRHSIEFIDCYGRAKHLYSLYKKMQRKNLTLKEIYDAIALRIILKNVDDCYLVLSLVHEAWQVIIKEFDDYIAKPKNNGYQSIHTAILVNDLPIEIQIRTQCMHDAAEIGVAAHWLYKEGNASDIKNKSKWLSQLTTLSPVRVDSDEPNSFEQHAIKLFQDRVFVFTPKGEVVDLIRGATALDFAYCIHSQVGNKCRGVKINGSIATLKTELVNGDTVEVLTHKNGKPSFDWLKEKNGYLKTARARAKVAQWFRQHDIKTQELGRSAWQRFCKNHVLDASKFAEEYCKSHNISLDVFYYKIGSDDINLKNLVKSQAVDSKKHHVIKEAAPVNALSHKGVQVQDCPGVQITLAACCFPIPGDEIIGVVTSARGVVVHRGLCNNSKQIKVSKQVDVCWGNDESLYLARLYCSCSDYNAANLAMHNILDSEKLRLQHLNVMGGKNKFTVEQVIFEIRFMIKGIEHLKNVMNKMIANKFIDDIWR